MTHKTKGKFQPKWEGPFVVESVYSNGSYRLITSNGDTLMMPTHHAEGNSMASPIQTVVGKGTSNPLITEGLLKILSGLSSTLSSKIPYQFSYIEW